jgi:hypothetical protein
MEEKRLFKSEPTLIVAPDGLNQYHVGGNAARIPLICRFLASTAPVSASMLEDLISSKSYKSDKFIDIDACIQEQGLTLAKNPWAFQNDSMSATMEVSFERSGKTGIEQAVKTFIQSSHLRGTIMSANGTTVSIREVIVSVSYLTRKAILN